MLEAIILAGGCGTRLRTIVSEMPKPMALIGGKPFLWWLLSSIRNQGVGKAILAVGYKAEMIQNYFGTNFNGLEIEYVVEAEPLGTGGALRGALNLIKGDRAFLFNGDSICDFDLQAMRKKASNNGLRMGIFVCEMEDVARYGSILRDADDRVIGFVEKGNLGSKYINAGVYDIPKLLLNYLPNSAPFSFESFLMGLDSEIEVIGIEAKSFFIDIGIPQDYLLAQKLLPAWFPYLTQGLGNEAKDWRQL